MLKALDIFCGAGGSSDGARSAGVEMVGGIDMDPIAAQTWKDNFPTGHMICDRLEDVHADRVRGWYADIDVLMASPECTNHSPAKGGAPRSEASKDTAMLVVEYARTLRPRWLVIENVVQMRPWAKFGLLTASLRNLGYKLSEPQVLDAKDFGVAQSRRRLFLLADLEREPPLIVAPPAVRSGVHSILDMETVWPVSDLRKVARATATLARADAAIKALGPDTAFLLVYYGSDGGGGWQSLDRPLRTITTLDRFALVQPTPEGHTMRMLQPTELRRAMGLSSQFKLERGSRRDKIRLLGNGVCAPVMTSILTQLMASSLAPLRAATSIATTRDLFEEAA